VKVEEFYDKAVEFNRYSNPNKHLPAIILDSFEF